MGRLIVVQKAGLEPAHPVVGTRSLVLRVCQFHHFCECVKA